MCYSCWEEYNKPTLDTPLIRYAAECIERVYDYSMTGGHMHITVDDWNIENSHLDTCEAAINENLFDGPDEQLATEKACLTALRSLSVEERASALALKEGMFQSMLY